MVILYFIELGLLSFLDMQRYYVFLKHATQILVLFTTIAIHIET